MAPFIILLVPQKNKYLENRNVFWMYEKKLMIVIKGEIYYTDVLDMNTIQELALNSCIYSGLVSFWFTKKNCLSDSSGNQIILVALLRFNLLKGTGSLKSFIRESDYTGCIACFWITKKNRLRVRNRTTQGVLFVE